MRPRDETVFGRFVPHRQGQIAHCQLFEAILFAIGDLALAIGPLAL